MERGTKCINASVFSKVLLASIEVHGRLIPEWQMSGPLNGQIHREKAVAALSRASEDIFCLVGR